jgi:transcriptional repressor NrdR
MRCPFCRRANSRVVDTRSGGEGFVVRRRRSCPGCRKRFTTYERLERVVLYVVKQDGRREPFDRLKLKRSLVTACTKRTVPVEKIDEAVARIEAAVHEKHDREVGSRVVGDLAIQALRKLDRVAYVRFASVYRDYRDPSEFVAEARQLMR